MIRNDLEFLRLDAALEAVAVARALRAEARAALVEVRLAATDANRQDRREIPEDLTYEEAVRCLEEQTREREASIARLEETRRLLESVRSFMTSETMTLDEALPLAGSGVPFKPARPFRGVASAAIAGGPCSQLMKSLDQRARSSARRAAASAGRGGCGGVLAASTISRSEADSMSFVSLSMKRRASRPGGIWGRNSMTIVPG